MKQRLFLCATLLTVVLAGYFAWHRFSLLHPALLPDVEPGSFYDASRARHFAASSQAAHAVRQWISAHQSGWEFSSAAISRNDTQISGDTYGIALTSHKILLDYKTQPNQDDDDDVHLERALSPQEQAAWGEIITKILAYNSVLEPPPTSNTALQRTAGGTRL